MIEDSSIACYDSAHPTPHTYLETLCVHFDVAQICGCDCGESWHIWCCCRVWPTLRAHYCSIGDTVHQTHQAEHDQNIKIWINLTLVWTTKASQKQLTLKIMSSIFLIHIYLKVLFVEMYFFKIWMIIKGFKVSKLEVFVNVSPQQEEWGAEIFNRDCQWPICLHFFSG